MLAPMSTEAKNITAKLAATKVLVVDDEYYMRKVVRTLLSSIGVRNIYEAQDGPSGLEAIRTVVPDVVIVDWEMPGLDGAGFVRMVRSPETFPYPNVPIIMLTGHGERSRVVEAVSVGVNEFLLKPVSSKSLQDRMVAVLTKPRPFVQTANYYGPAPRNLTKIHADTDESIVKLVLVN